MNFKSFHQVTWYCKRTVRMAGWPAVAALLLVAAGAMAWYLALNPLKTRIGLLQQNARELHSRATLRLPVQPEAANPAAELAQFYRFFPSKTSIPDLMTKLYAAASEQNVILDQGDYRLVHEQDKKLVRYEITFPVKGGYAQLRKFMAQALDEVPSLSLDSISFTRQKSNDPLVDAQIRFTLYLSNT